MEKPDPGSADQGCPATYVCLTQSQAIVLGKWLRAMAAWSKDAWAACGPLPDEPEAVERKEL